MSANYRRGMHMVNGHQVAEALGISLVALWRLVKAEKFPRPVYFAERFYRWKASDVEQYLRDNPREGGSAQPPTRTPSPTPRSIYDDARW